MTKLLIAVVFIGAIISGLFLLFNQEQPLLLQGEGVRQYSGHGISFSYPSHYFLEERNTGNAERTRYSILLTEDTEENRLVREGTSPGREGPTAILVEIFQNDLDRITAEEWIKGTEDSNYKLSPDSILTPRTVGGLPGLEYRWSGLYEARAVAVANEMSVYSLTATYLTPEDLILKDFETLLGGVKFE